MILKYKQVKPSEVKVTETTTDEEGHKRRRSSLWSSGSRSSRGSIASVLTGAFRRDSTVKVEDHTDVDPPNTGEA